VAGAVDGDFALLARGNFLVSASIAKGVIAAVEVQSNAGGELRLRNPWPGKMVAAYRGGDAAGEMSGDVLTMQTGKGEVMTFVPAGSSLPAQRRVS
jgi:hypothetical protein